MTHWVQPVNDTEQYRVMLERSSIGASYFRKKGLIGSFGLPYCYR